MITATLPWAALATAPASPGAIVSHTPAIVIADIAVIIAAAQIMGMLFRRFRQPSVLGEIIGGILLGPSLLGAFPGHLTTKLFPGDSVPHLQVLAQIGVVLFMFVVGLELDLRVIRGRVGVATSVSLSSIALPFGLGTILAVFLLHPAFKTVNGHQVKSLGFVLFIGAAMSITAFPVLARILTERGMQRTQLGTLALASAAVDDLMAWSLLALVIGIVTSSGALGLPLTLIETAAMVLGLVYIGRPLFNRAFRRYRSADAFPIDLLAVTLIGLLGIAALADKIGVDVIFGGFVFGATFPKQGNEELVAKVVQRIESLAVVLLLPIFFMVTGLSVNVRTIGWNGLGYLMAILAVAIGGKFLGATVAARSQRLTIRQSAALGTLMNTRGLTELVILNAGKQLGVLSPKLFTLMVVMAIVTTVMTEPLMRLVYPDHMIQADLADAERELEGGQAPGYRALVLLDHTGPDPMMALAADLVGPGGTVWLASYLPSHAEEGSTSVTVDLQRVAAGIADLQRHTLNRPGVAVRPQVRVSPDPAAEVIDQVGRSAIDVVMVGADTPAADRLVADAPCHVIVHAASGPPDAGPVTVVMRDGVDNDTAFELAARIAMGRPGATGLCLVPGDQGQRNRSRRVADQASQVSLLHDRAVVADEVAAGSQLVVGLRSALAARTVRTGTVLAVRSADDGQRINMDQRIGRLSTQAGIAARSAPGGRAEAAPVTPNPVPPAPVTPAPVTPAAVPPAHRASGSTTTPPATTESTPQ